MTSPQPERRREIMASQEIGDNVKGYLMDSNKRSALKRSMAKTMK